MFSGSGANILLMIFLKTKTGNAERVVLRIPQYQIMLALLAHIQNYLLFVKQTTSNDWCVNFIPRRISSSLLRVHSVRFRRILMCPDICYLIRKKPPGISKSQWRKQIQSIDKCILWVTRITPNTEIDIKMSNAVEISSGQKTRTIIFLNLLIYLSRVVRSRNNAATLNVRWSTKINSANVMMNTNFLTLQWTSRK